MWRGGRCVCAHICGCAKLTVCVCVRLTHMCSRAYTHAYAHAINTSPSVPATQLDCDGMSQHNPHRLKRSPPAPTCTQPCTCSCTLTHAHVSSENTPQFKLFFPPLSASSQCSATVGPLCLPPPRLAGHTFQAELRPARTRKCGTATITWGVPLSTVRLRRERKGRNKQTDQKKNKNLSSCHFVYVPVRHSGSNSPWEAKAQQYMQRLGKGPFAPCCRDICLLPHALSHCESASARETL